MSRIVVRSSSNISGLRWQELCTLKVSSVYTVHVQIMSFDYFALFVCTWSISRLDVGPIWFTCVLILYRFGLYCV